MKLQFNKFERMAGIFVIVAVFGFFASLLSVAVKQGWFENKVFYTTVFQSAEGVHMGTSVQIAGLKAGSVDDVELTAENKIFIHFYVFAKFNDRIRTDSVTSLIRPFVIGERVLDVSPGSQSAEKLAANSKITSAESTDLITMMSGRELGESMAAMTEMLGNLKNLAQAFLNKDRTNSFLQMFDHIDPLIKNLNSMSVEVVKLSKTATKDDRLGQVLADLSVTTKQLNAMLPEFQQASPHVAKDMGTLLTNLTELTTEFRVLIPAVQAIAPELPRTSKRAVEALDEAVVLMKSMEKSFLVRGNVKEVREEEEAAKRARTPASP
jgi:phospholipid/cholesterol/gamma-HCH transport system substrate-binding protein